MTAHPRESSPALPSWLVVTLAVATAPASAAAADSCALFDHEHAAWSALLGEFVRDGWVDYTGLAARGGEQLRSYLGELESVCRGHYAAWPRDRQLAFWINAYNAYTVALILEHHPIASIRNIGWLPHAAFRRAFIPLKALRGATLSLNDIEHEIIRKEFREPRIHFALVCASKGCPPLRSEAYRAPLLDQQLDAAARAFVRDSDKNRFDGATRTLYLSSIFDWFRADFEGAARSVPEFVARYAHDATAQAIRGGEVAVRFLDYDWSLNGR